MSFLDRIFKRKDDKADSFDLSTIDNLPYPICFFNKGNKLSYANLEFKKEFEDEKLLITTKQNFFELEDSKNPDDFEFTYADKVFRVRKIFDNNSGTKYLFSDLSNEKLFDKIIHDKENVLINIVVDNYDEIISNASYDKKGNLSTMIETVIRDFAREYEMSIIRHRVDKYFLVSNLKTLNIISENKWKVLDDVKNIDMDSDVPISISIGVGMGGETENENYVYADDAIEFALGRGGDQVVMNNKKAIEFFGAETQYIPVRNKGRSRRVSFLITKGLSTASNVVVLMHKNPDYDSLGSAIGIASLIKNNDKDVYIVMGKTDKDTIEAIKPFNELFVSSQTAMNLIDERTLIIIVDTQSDELIEDLSFTTLPNEKLIIDHHLKIENTFTNIKIPFIEPTASSTSELVTEILQFAGGDISKREANLLLAGIVVDTNRFMVKTGKRTFEAVAFLREQGADNLEVYRLLQSSSEEIFYKNECLKNVSINGGIAVLCIPNESQYNEMSVPKIADELLEIKDVLVSFVLYKSGNEIIIKARSLGSVNVQKILEKFGGGGHFSVASAAVKNKDINAIADELIALTNI